MTTILPVIDIREVANHKDLEDDLLSYGSALTSWANYYLSTEEEREKILQCFVSTAQKGFRWILDSGAIYLFGQKNKMSDQEFMEFHDHFLGEYIDFLNASPYSIKNKEIFEEYYVLDVIYDFNWSWNNLMKMDKAGLKPAPVYHQNGLVNRGQLDQLVKYAGPDGLVGLGGLVSSRKTYGRDWSKVVGRWLSQIRSLHPKQRFHALGVATFSILGSIHFEYADSGTWTHDTAKAGRVQLMGTDNKVRDLRISQIAVDQEYLSLASPILTDMNLNHIDDLRG